MQGFLKMQDCLNYGTGSYMYVQCRDQLAQIYIDSTMYVQRSSQLELLDLDLDLATQLEENERRSTSSNEFFSLSLPQIYWLQLACRSTGTRSYIHVLHYQAQLVGAYYRQHQLGIPTCTGTIESNEEHRIESSNMPTRIIEKQTSPTPTVGFSPAPFLYQQAVRQI